MAKVFPFQSLRPAAHLAQQVAAVPYDVVDRDEARALAAGNPNSFLHVTKPEIDLPNDQDPYADAVYAAGAEALSRLQRDGVLVREAKPCFYLYALSTAAHTQTGFVFLGSIDDYDRNIVRKHEQTRPDVETDRVRNMEALGAQSGTVFLCHRDSAALKTTAEKATQEPPVQDFTTADGIRHRVWVLAEDATIAAITAAFEALGPIYIADGHHRTAAASRAAANYRQRGTASEANQRFLAVSFPVSETQVLPFHRVIKDLNGLTSQAFLQRLEEACDVSKGKPQSAAETFGMYLDGAWYGLKARPGSFDPSDLVGRMDVNILHHNVLSPILGVGNPRHDKRIAIVGGVDAEQRLIRRVDGGDAVGFTLHPVGLADLLAIADAEQFTPPKSTCFEPKLRDGLFVHQF